jgi:hypothetical protein
MNRIARPVAVPAAVLVFFIMAGVGVYWDVAPHAVALKAAAGAVVTYIIVSLAVKVFVRVMVDSMVRSKLNEIERQNRMTVNE